MRRPSAPWREWRAVAGGTREDADAGVAPPILALRQKRVMTTLFNARDGEEIRTNTPVTATGCHKAKNTRTSRRKQKRKH
jgi:hypothetical protein